LSNRANSSNLRNILIFPTQDYLALAAFQICGFCAIALAIPKKSPLVFISFSAGVVSNWGSFGMAIRGHVKVIAYRRLGGAAFWQLSDLPV